MSTDSRQAVFARIKEALKQPAPHRQPHGHDHGHLHDAPMPGSASTDSPNVQNWLPKVGTTREEQLELFRTNSKGLQTDFRVVRNRLAATDYLKELATKNRWQRIGTHHHPLAEQIAWGVGLPTLFADSGYKVDDLELCDAGVTGCDALVAQTGSILVSNESAGGRALSVLPPHHVVIARIDQLVPDLSAALSIVRERYANRWPSFLSFITGPSRTGDIERILVLGAHGPRQLTIILLTE